MPVITLKPLYLQGSENIGLITPNSPELTLAIRKLAKAKWNERNGCWYVPLDDGSLAKLEKPLKEVAEIDGTLVAKYLAKRNEVKKTLSSQLTSREKVRMEPIYNSPAWRLNKENLEALQRLVEELKLKAYSQSTTKTYRNEFLQLLQLLKNKNVNELATDDLRRYFVYCLEKLKLTENTLHSRINAIKFYFEQVLGRDRFFWEIPRPKKRTELPRVLNQDEVAAIINGTDNKKHKTMLMLTYSAGLRVSEVVALRTADIDSKRMTIMVRQGKGKKDRLVGLSPLLLVMLREYAREYKPGKGKLPVLRETVREAVTVQEVYRRC